MARRVAELLREVEGVEIVGPVGDGREALRAFVEASRRAETRGVTGLVVLVVSVVAGLGVLFVLYRTLERDAREKERRAEEFAATLQKTQDTPESERVRAIKKLIEEKNACERELERRADCAPLDAGAD